MERKLVLFNSVIEDKIALLLFTYGCPEKNLRSQRIRRSQARIDITAEQIKRDLSLMSRYYKGLN